MKSEDITALASSITAIAVILTVIQVSLSKKQLNLSTISRCMDQFRSMEDLYKAPDARIAEYIDLVNEELFFIQHGYIPTIIAREWIDGMIDYIPVFNNNNEIINQNTIIKSLEAKHPIFLKNFTRVKAAFTVKSDYSAHQIFDKDILPTEKISASRRLLIDEILLNIKNYSH